MGRIGLIEGGIVRFRHLTPHTSPLTPHTSHLTPHLPSFHKHQFIRIQPDSADGSQTVLFGKSLACL